jgi:S1-C subfamily serine protease
MYQEAISNIKNSIFPIFFISVQGQKVQIGVSGTGFFISNQGHFLTALHVITDVPENSTLQYRGNIPEHIVNPPSEIQEIYRDPIRDIFLGRVNIEGTIPVTFSLDRPRAGKSVCLCGYPLAQLNQNPAGTLNVGGVRQYWQPTFIIDAITVTDQTKNYIGFITQDTSLNGMSGGPVFDNAGVVYGVDTAFITREIPQKDGKPAILLHNGVALENASITDVYAITNHAK